MQRPASAIYLSFCCCLVAALLLEGCAVRSVYVPTSHNVVLPDGRRQIQANAYVGANHAELQAAFNPADHLLMGLNTNYGTGLSSYEAQLGLYGYSKHKAQWRYELQAGGGYTSNFSQQENAFLSAVQKKNINYETYSIYNKVFVQPALGFFSTIDMYKLNYSFSFACRGSYLDFRKYRYREISRDSLAKGSPDPYVLNRDYSNKRMFILEPCFINKVGKKNLSAVVQCLFIFPLSSEIDLHYANLSPVFLLSLGVQYNFIFKKQKAAKS